MSRQLRSDQGQVRVMAGLVMSDRDSSGQVRSLQERSVPIPSRSGYVKSGQVRPGQVRSDPG